MDMELSQTAPVNTLSGGACELQSTGRVLLVDDDPCIRNFLGLVLKGTGFSVRLAENGRQAYELFLEEPFDLVITDYKMPVMNGPELIGRIRRIAPLMPVIVITGLEPEEIAELCRPLSIDAYLYKPFTDKELVRAARQAVRH